MARKKKDSQSDTKETNVEPLITETPQSTSSNINYKGSVKVTLKKGNKIVSSRTYHNTGGIPLYKFLLYCLAGEYSENDRPTYIVLYYTADQTNPQTPKLGTKVSTTIAANRFTVTMGTTPTLTAHFIIPCSMIESSTGEVNQAAMYSNINIGRAADGKDFSMMYNFVESSQFVPIKISSAAGDYNVFIEWTMSFNSVA